ncbi:hypothetical protein Hanom_Chr08g00719811 [Helianthus anomalus]
MKLGNRTPLFPYHSFFFKPQLHTHTNSLVSLSLGLQFRQPEPALMKGGSGYGNSGKTHLHPLRSPSRTLVPAGARRRFMVVPPFTAN